MMIKQNVLDSMCLVFKKAKKSGLKKELFKELNSELSVISEDFRISKEQAFIYAIIYNMYQESGVVFIHKLVDYFSCNFSKLNPFLCNVNGLIKKDLLHVCDTSLRDLQKQDCVYIDISICNNEESEARENEDLNIFQELQNFIDIVYREIEGWSHVDLFNYTSSFVRSHSEEKLFSFLLKDKNLSSFELCVILCVVWKNLMGIRRIEAQPLFSEIFRRSVPLQLLHYNKLLEKTLSEDFYKVVSVDNYIDEDFRYVYCLKLSIYTYNQLKAQGIEVITSNLDILDYDDIEDFQDIQDIEQTELDKEIGNVKTESEVKLPDTMRLITSDCIGKKNLIFSESQEKELFFVRQILKEEIFAKAQNKFQEDNAPKGILVMLQGGPGTGKTESVYQMAKECNRSIIKIETCELFSKYIGDSEKLIKEVFTTYKSYCEERKGMLKPILFFNEADSVFSKRLTHIERTNDQSHNAIINILLEELEIFDGILLATTNLVGNLDIAFERRFLFKIEIQKPDANTRALILKSRLNFLSLEDSKTLAEKFELSGGQIENIFRKVTLNSLLNSKQVTLSEIEALCMQECFEREDAYSSNRQKVIGYKTS